MVALSRHKPLQAKTIAEKLSGTARPLTARAVAELCGVELKTIHNWATEGVLEHFRTPGRHLRFQPLSVLQFLENCGYELPVSRDSKLFVIVKSAASRKLKGVLSEHRVVQTSDIFSALITAGRNRPEAIIVEFNLARLPQPLWVEMGQALRRELPETRLILLAAKPTTSKSIKGWAWATLESLQSEFKS